MTVWRIHNACWVPKATNTLSCCVMLIAFPLQQWLNERASMLRYTTMPAVFLLLFVAPFTSISIKGCHCEVGWIGIRHYRPSCKVKRPLYLSDFRHTLE